MRLEGLDLDAVAVLATQCTFCRISRTRTNVVFGRGNPDADVMVVLDAPGYADDRTGEPVSAAVGDELASLLREVHLSSDDVYVTTVLKCRPPQCRTPFPDEVEACEGYLFRQVALVRPRTIVAMGRISVLVLTGRHIDLREHHGQVISRRIAGLDVDVVCAYHPGAALHSEALMASLRHDLARAFQPDANAAGAMSGGGYVSESEASDGPLQLEFEIAATTGGDADAFHGG